MNDTTLDHIKKISEVINNYPEIAPQVEELAAAIQGKGFGASTIELEVQTCIALLGRRPSLAIDIGANIGNYTAELLRVAPGIEVHSFEPSATNILILKDRFHTYSNVVLCPHGASNKSRSAELFSDQLGSGLASLNVRRLDHFGINFGESEAVELVRFEEYWKSSLMMRDIDILKIDTEGHELSVLEGLGDSVAAIDLIQFEFGGCNIDSRTYFQDFWYFFQEHKFSLYRISPLGPVRIHRYDEKDEHFRTTNFIAKRIDRKPITREI